ncbi:tartrate dehydrogenase [Mesorhizobium sp. ASY16-5R]|uniref:tartrate dehydrogenase n=1 Tax=Mesorhizobium sp. ASY16-5R TaxID=3445772 RepID=UPI003F9FDAE5
MAGFRIAVIEGDGIGKEVVPEGIRVVEASAKAFGLDISWDRLDWGCDHHARHGRMMPANGLDRIAGHDAIFLGAIGWPTVSDVESLWTLLMPIRRNFQQYVNLRPVRLFEGVPSPLASPGDIDFYIVRENNEGEYSEIGGRMFPDMDQEMVSQETILTRFGCDRVMRFAFNLARKRKKKLTSATKSNGIIHTMPFWDERFRANAKEFPDVATEQYHIDILTAHFVRRPASFDVVVASNLFGDILSDLGPAVTGTIGIAPSGNLNPERRFPSMFEPVHGSAPDIAGQNIANPIGQIWSGAMMLEHLGAKDAADAIVSAIERVLASGENLTRDMGGTASTSSLGQAVADAISKHPAKKVLVDG